MVDAAGAVYVIGGWNVVLGTGAFYYNDVWVSTDGGARPDSGTGGGRRGALGYYEGYSAVLLGTIGGTKGTTRVRSGSEPGYLGGTFWYYRGTKDTAGVLGVLQGVLRVLRETTGDTTWDTTGVLGKYLGVISK